jgi:hypothetical protein
MRLTALLLLLWARGALKARQKQPKAVRRLGQQTLLVVIRGALLSQATCCTQCAVLAWHAPAAQHR